MRTKEVIIDEPKPTEAWRTRTEEQIAKLQQLKALLIRRKQIRDQLTDADTRLAAALAKLTTEERTRFDREVLGKSAGATSAGSKFSTVEEKPVEEVSETSSTSITAEALLDAELSSDPTQLRHEIGILEETLKRPVPTVQLIGDVHGDIENLDQVIDPKADKYYFLGDLIDRGGQSLKVLARLKELYEQKATDGKPKAEFLLGNHETFFLAAMEGNVDALLNWVANGGDVVISETDSGLAQQIIRECMALRRDIHQRRTNGEHGASPEAIAQFTQNAVEPLMQCAELKQWAEWLRAHGRFFMLRDGTLMVHAGIPVDENGQLLDVDSEGRSGIDGLMSWGYALRNGTPMSDLWSINAEKTPFWAGKRTGDFLDDYEWHERVKDPVDLIAKLNEQWRRYNQGVPIERIVYGHTITHGSVRNQDNRLLGIDAQLSGYYGGHGGALYLDKDGVRWVPRQHAEDSAAYPMVDIDRRHRTIADTDASLELHRQIERREQKLTDLERATDKLSVGSESATTEDTVEARRPGQIEIAYNQVFSIDRKSPQLKRQFEQLLTDAGLTFERVYAEVSEHGEPGIQPLISHAEGSYYLVTEPKTGQSVVVPCPWLEFNNRALIDPLQRFYRYDNSGLGTGKISQLTLATPVEHLGGERWRVLERGQLEFQPRADRATPETAAEPTEPISAETVDRVVRMIFGDIPDDEPTKTKFFDQLTQRGFDAWYVESAIVFGYLKYSNTPHWRAITEVFARLFSEPADQAMPTIEAFADTKDPALLGVDLAESPSAEPAAPVPPTAPAIEPVDPSPGELLEQLRQLEVQATKSTQNLAQLKADADRDAERARLLREQLGEE